MNSIHAVRDTFNLSKFLQARDLTINAVHKIKESIEVDMTERDVHTIIETTIKDMGADKLWHPSKFRIGSNTTKSFRDESDIKKKLKPNDIFFIDIGPVWDNHEGDYGETFIYGNKPEYKKIINATKDIFKRTSEIWKNENKTGKELYEFASCEAASMGFELNNRMKGHRVGDFPHHLFYRGGLIEIEESPCDNLWILEVHLIDKSKEFGAFYEDILKK